MDSGRGSEITHDQAPPAPKLPAATRLPALDGIRGVAILLVLFYHLFRYDNSLLGRLSHHGWLGVELFFVLSGFLITGILYDSRGEVHYFRNFYGRRVLRIFPLYYGFLAVAALLAPLLIKAQLQGIHTYIHYQVWWWLYAANILESIKGWICAAFDPFWSLAIEEHFYLIWPLLIALAPKR